MTTPTNEPEHDGKPLSQWLSECRSENTETRAAAVQALGVIAAPSTIPTLVDLLDDKDFGVANAAATALGKIGAPAIPALVALLRNEEQECFTSDEVLHALGQIGTPAIPVLLELIQDEKGLFGPVAGRVLGQLGSQAETTLPTLLKCLRHQEWQVQEAAAQALTGMQSAANAAVPQLIELLKDDAPAVRSITVRLLRVLAKPDVFLSAVTTLLATETDSLVQTAAIDAMSQIGPAAIPILTKLLANTDADVRTAAIFDLASMGSEGKVAIPDITESARHDEWYVRQAVARALGMLGATESIPILSELTADRDYRVQMAAIVAIAEVNPEETDEAISLFVEWLQHEDTGVRCEAAKCLGRIGPKAKSAIPALTMMLKDHNVFVQEAADLALSNIKDRPQADHAE